MPAPESGQSSPHLHEARSGASSGRELLRREIKLVFDEQAINNREDKIRRREISQGFVGKWNAELSLFFSGVAFSALYCNWDKLSTSEKVLGSGIALAFLANGVGVAKSNHEERQRLENSNLALERNNLSVKRNNVGLEGENFVLGNENSAYTDMLMRQFFGDLHGRNQEGEVSIFSMRSSVDENSEQGDANEAEIKEEDNPEDDNGSVGGSSRE